MSRGIILYQSKYGATRKYAQWLQESTGYECVETKKANRKDVQKYETIILGGGVYASGIAGLSFLKNNIDQFKNKKIAVFCVGASPYDEKAYKQMGEMHFKDKLQEIPLFYCRGAWDLEQMSFADRTLCKLLQKAVAKKDSSAYEPWEKALMCAGEQKCDWTERKYLDALLEYVKNE